MKVSKSIIFLVESFLGNFYRHFFLVALFASLPLFTFVYRLCLPRTLSPSIYLILSSLSLYLSLSHSFSFFLLLSPSFSFFLMHTNTNELFGNEETFLLQQFSLSFMVDCSSLSGFIFLSVLLVCLLFLYCYLQVCILLVKCSPSVSFFLSFFLSYNPTSSINIHKDEIQKVLQL